MSAFTSFESVSAPVAGESRQLRAATAHHTMIVGIEGTPVNCVVYLEGSHDGFRWVTIHTYQNTESGMVSTSPNGPIMMHVRARLAILQGANGAKVSASIASADDA